MNVRWTIAFPAWNRCSERNERSRKVEADVAMCPLPSLLHREEKQRWCCTCSLCTTITNLQLRLSLFHLSIAEPGKSLLVQPSPALYTAFGGWGGGTTSNADEVRGNGVPICQSKTKPRAGPKQQIVKVIYILLETPAKHMKTYPVPLGVSIRQQWRGWEDSAGMCWSRPLVLHIPTARYKIANPHHEPFNQRHLQPKYLSSFHLISITVKILGGRPNSDLGPLEALVQSILYI